MADIQGLLKKYKAVKDERFFHDVFEGQEYKPILDKKADVVIDVGALAGEFSAYIYEKAEKIYALEPNPEFFKELTDNITTFHLNKVVASNVALSNINGISYLSTEETRGGSKLLDFQDTRKKIAVPSETLASFMKRNNIAYVDVLKIDIEGHEEAVFKSNDFVLVADKIKCIIGEHLHEGADKVLRQHGFTRTVLEGNVNCIYEH